MALIECPSCTKRISDKSTSCPFCGFKLAGMSAQDQEREWQRIQQEKKDKLVSQSMLALIIAIGAFAYMYLAQPYPESWQAQVAYGLIIVSVIWFVANRIRLLFIKKKRR